jgi:hypothetical protein
MQVVLNEVHSGQIGSTQAASVVDTMTRSFEACLVADGWTCDDSRDQCHTPADVVGVSSSVTNYLSRYVQLLKRSPGAGQ